MKFILAVFFLSLFEVYASDYHYIDLERVSEEERVEYILLKSKERNAEWSIYGEDNGKYFRS